MATEQRPNLVLQNLKFGGVPVAWTRATGTLNIAGEELTLKEWLEKRRRLDMLLKRELSAEQWKQLREEMAWLGKRSRLPMELREYERPARLGASSFLERNLEAINAMQGGTLRRAPWWLRWLFPVVVTKGQDEQDRVRLQPLG